MNVVVTGGAGFIGSHLCQALLAHGSRVTAIDNFDPFYPEAVKRSNLAPFLEARAFRLIEADICDLGATTRALAGERPDVVVHLAARAGVRPSIEDPALYARVNVEGTVATLELAHRLGVRRFIFGSSSSVYGNNAKVPFSEADPVDHPISPYAATKRAGELLCHTYHHLYEMSVICLRFFTVYGPRQRPDLAIHKFARLMEAGETIPFFGDGESGRDYTYVDDIVQGIQGAIDLTGKDEPIFEIINLGGNRVTTLRRLVQLLAGQLGREPTLKRLPSQPGDVERTFADVSRAVALLGYRPDTPIEEGIGRFVQWLRDPESSSDPTRLASPSSTAAFSQDPGRGCVGQR